MNSSVVEEGALHPLPSCAASRAETNLRSCADKRLRLAAISAIVLMIFVAGGVLLVSDMRVSGALERERRNSYAQRIALADRNKRVSDK